MKSTWKKYLHYATYTLLASGLIYGLLQLILSGYAVTWTGFQTKTLWDWMELLIIPIVLAIGVFFLNRSERNTERELANERQQEVALQAYIGAMAELLLDKKLRTTKIKEVRNVARTLTLSTMRGMNGSRKNLIIQFLREAGLVSDKTSILIGAKMQGMNLRNLNLSAIYLIKSELRRANLQNVNFNRANLQETVLYGANLRDANLMAATLIGADCEDANFRNAELHSAILEYASLDGADLRNTNSINANFKNTRLEKAIFRGANLDGANFQGADVTPEQLAQARSLKGTILPDGTVHD